MKGYTAVSWDEAIHLVGINGLTVCWVEIPTVGNVTWYAIPGMADSPSCCERCREDYSRNQEYQVREARRADAMRAVLLSKAGATP